MIKIKKGLNLPITGAPEQVIQQASSVKTVAILGPDYVGMKPTMFVKEGDSVQVGQKLFSDKKNEGVIFTAPASGKVVAVNRGERRVFQSLVIAIDGHSHVEFQSYKNKRPSEYTYQEAKDLLLESGVWTSFKTRPFSKIPSVDSKPHSIFVNVMDTHPLSAKPEVILKGKEKSFVAGLEIIAKLTSGQVYLISEKNVSVPGRELSFVSHKEFFGPHPAGLSGTHIHFIDPVHLNKSCL